MLFRKFNHFAYRCIMQGEHRPVLSDLLWARAEVIMESMESHTSQNAEQEGTMIKIATELRESLMTTFKEIKTPEDILLKAKTILKKHSQSAESNTIV